MFFGAYLVEQGLVRKEQILVALELQHFRRIPLGRIAMRAQKMSLEQVFETLNHEPDYDQRFGEAAIGLGFLRPEDLKVLIKIQQSEMPPIGKILVEIGALDGGLMEAALAEFHVRSVHQ